MKKKIVLWGNDANDEKILVAIELIDADNKVNIHTYPEAAATEEVYNIAMNQWRDNDSIELPEGYTSQERPLSITDDLLPEDIKVERTDIIARAKAEWHFIVLSSKLYQMYSSELEDYKEKIDNMSDYSEQMWEEMKTFWNKIQEQVRDKNLFREHAGILREKTNNLFDKLKELKKSFQNEFKKESSEKAAKFREELEQIEEKIEKGLGLKPLFNQLKNIQSRFKEERFTKDDQRKLWNKIDAAFKSVKEKQFGGKAQSSNGALERITRRYNGLLNAINKMEKSIARDKSDLDWENKKIERTDGQLEMQIRQAKIKMIEERVNSKGEKLADMMKTKVELERKIEVEKQRAEKRAEKEKAKEVAKQVKQKIATEIQEKKEARSEDAEKLTSLSEEVKSSKSSKAKEEKKEEAGEESILAAATSQIGEALGNVVDTVKAVAEVIEDKLEDKLEEVSEKAKEFKEEKIDPALEQVKANAEQMAEKAEEAFENAKKEIKEVIDGKEEEEKKGESTPAQAEENTSKEEEE